MDGQGSGNEELILKRTESGYIFLDATACSIYESRSQNCENFLRGDGSMLARMSGLQESRLLLPGPVQLSTLS
jgi:hypothetical protein